MTARNYEKLTSLIRWRRKQLPDLAGETLSSSFLFGKVSLWYSGNGNIIRSPECQVLWVLSFGLDNRNREKYSEKRTTRFEHGDLLLLSAKWLYSQPHHTHSTIGRISPRAGTFEQEKKFGLLNCTSDKRRCAHITAVPRALCSRWTQVDECYISVAHIKIKQQILWWHFIELDLVLQIWVLIGGSPYIK